MEQNKIAVGLDIGTTKIVAMVGRYNEYNKLEILGIGKSASLGVHRGVVNNITKTTKSIQSAIKEAEEAAGIKIDNVTVGIAGQHIRSLQHSDYIVRENSEEVIEQEDIDQLCQHVHRLTMLPGEEILHVLPQEFKVDGQSEITEPEGMYGSRLEANFHVVLGQIVAIKNIGRCVKSSGLGLSGITLEPLASSKAVLSDEEKEAGVALIDIGGGTTDLAIFKDGIIRHTAVIPFGGNVITEDIKEGCTIIEKQAELLKVKFGSAWPGENKENEIVSIPGLRGRDPKEISLKNLSKIINARVAEIIELVFQEIKNYGYNSNSKKLIAGIVLTGGGSQLKHLKQLVEYITGLDTRIGYPNEYLASDSEVEATSPLYATAVGLVMNGIELKSKIQLTDEIENEQETTFQKVENEEVEFVEKAEEVNEKEPIQEQKEDRKSLLSKLSEKITSIIDNSVE